MNNRASFASASSSAVNHNSVELIDIKCLKLHQEVSGLNIAKSNVKLVNHEVRPELPFQDLIQKHGFYVAGGAAVSLIWDIKYNDIDLFMVNAENQEEKINSFIKSLPNVLYVKRNNCCATIIMKDLPKIQIIFYNYKSMYEILANFDIGSCSFIMHPDGTIYTDKKGSVAYTCKLNRLDINMRQSSLEPRLVKYFNRGFSIQIDGFKLAEGLTTYNHIAFFVQDGQLIEVISKRHSNINSYDSFIFTSGNRKYWSATTDKFTSIADLNNVDNYGELEPIDYKVNYSEIYRKDAAYTIENYYEIDRNPRNFSSEINKYSDYYKFPFDEPEKIALFKHIAKIYGFNKCMTIIPKLNGRVYTISEKLHHIGHKFDYIHENDEITAHYNKNGIPIDVIEKVAPPPDYNTKYYLLKEGQKLFISREIKKLVELIRPKAEDKYIIDSKLTKELEFNMHNTPKQILSRLTSVYVQLM